MTLSEYQSFTPTTNQYPKDRMLECLTMGLCSEAGEVAGKVKKFYRGDNPDTGLRLLVQAELGDVMYYVSEIANKMGFTLQEIIDDNYFKLRKRLDKGTIKGDGDSR